MGRFHQRPVPVALDATFALPFLPSLGVGAGMELVTLVIDRQLDEVASIGFSAGLTGRLRYRLPIGRFNLTAAIHGAVHPLEDRPQHGDRPPPGTRPPETQSILYPARTLGATVGVEFALF